MFFELLGEYLPRTVEEVKTNGRVIKLFNSTVITIIPKVDMHRFCYEYIPISLCNCVYKIIAKVIVVTLKILISNFISSEQFGFLKDRDIHEVVAST